MNDFKKYLPSKKFISSLLIVIIIVVVVLIVKSSVSLFKKHNGADNTIGLTEVTVGGVIQKDSNGNGIADWEEYLWGLNPNKNGESNKEFILSKKKALSQSGIISNSDNQETITDNELLSREFFATIVSLQQTGNLNEESIKSVSDAIGQKIEADTIPDIYTKSMLTIESDTPENRLNYLSYFIALAMKYQDMDVGRELTLISQGLGNNDPQALYAVNTIAKAYRSFGNELIKLPVPSNASNIVLNLANNYEKTAQSIENLTQILADPLIGMKGILNYKKYNDALVSEIGKLSQVLK